MPELLRQFLDAFEISPEKLPRPQERFLTRFFDWLAKKESEHVDRHLFLAYGATIGTRAVLSDLEKALVRCLPEQHSLRTELRAAVLDHRRSVDGIKMVVEIVSAPWWSPFAANCDLDRLSILEIRRLDGWLSWMHERGKVSPSARDFVEWAASFDSEIPLVSLQAALWKLDLPKIPALALELPNAIAEKRAIARGPKAPRPRTRWPRELSVAPEELPGEWRDTLQLIRSRDAMSEARRPSKNTLRSHGKRLRELAWSCRAAGREPALTADALSLYVRELRERGCRATTCEINASFLVRFAEYHGVERRELDAMKAITKDLKPATQHVVPLKFERLSMIGSTEAVLKTAVGLLRKARSQRSLENRVSSLNGACALALFSLVPLRVIDTNLQWGKHVTFDGVRYRLDVVTSKRGNAFSGPLVEFLTPFLDALLLRGCDRCFLHEFRRDAELKQRYLFSHSDDRQVSETCVANLWSRHVGCGSHIARTMVHTELGRMGAAGVAQALALCAQRAPETAKFYQDKAMTDALLLKSNELLLKGFSEKEVEGLFLQESR